LRNKLNPFLSGTFRDFVTWTPNLQTNCKPPEVQKIAALQVTDNKIKNGAPVGVKPGTGAPCAYGLQDTRISG